MKLLPCPFCGGQPDVVKHFKHPMWNLMHRCSVMGPLSIDWKDSKAALENQWNQRYTGWVRDVRVEDGGKGAT